MEDFKLEVYFAKYEFVARHLLCCSDAESLSLKDLLALGDEECLNLWENLWLGYTETKGLPLLRKEVSSIYDNVDIESITCFAGAEEGIFCLFQSFISEADHVIVVTPCYQSLLSVVQSICSVSVLDLDADNDWCLDLDALEKLIVPGKTKMIVVNFPHNPTGCLFSKEMQFQLVQLADRFGIYIFSDEVYRGLQSNPDDLLPPMASIYSKGISLGVISKTLGFAGLRIGWIFSHDSLVIDSVSKYKHYLSICNSAPSEILALIALRNRTVIHSRNQEIVDSNLKILSLFLEKHKDIFSLVIPKGGCCGFMKYLGDRMSVDELADILANKYGVLILPDSMYPGSQKSYEQYFRIGFGRSNFPEALDIFEKACIDLLK